MLKAYHVDPKAKKMFYWVVEEKQRVQNQVEQKVTMNKDITFDENSLLKLEGNLRKFEVKAQQVEVNDDVIQMLEQQFDISNQIENDSQGQ